MKVFQVLRTVVITINLSREDFVCGFTHHLGGSQEIRPWTHMMELPQLHGLGPAASRLLDSYKLLLQVSFQLYYCAFVCGVLTNWTLSSFKI